MTPVAAKKMVLMSVLGLLIVATYKGRTGKVATSTRLWGTGWLAVMLGVTADFAPQIAGPFSLLVLAGSLTYGGDQAFINLLGRAGAGSGTQGTTGGAPQTGHQTAAGTSSGGPTGGSSGSGQNQPPSGPQGPPG